MMLKLDLILQIITQKGKNKNVIGLRKDELGRKIMTKCVGLGAKTYGYLIDDGSEYKKEKGTKRCVTKENLNLKIIETVQKQLNVRIK